MRDGSRFVLLIIFITTVLIVDDSFARRRTSLIPITEVQIHVGLSRSKVSGGETLTGTVGVRRNGNTQELVFRLETNNPAVRLLTTEVRIQPDESSAFFKIVTSPTPIRTTVDVKALLQPSDQLTAQRTLEIVPAILKGISLVQSTLHGTHGAKVPVRVELNTAAPTGGIELYLELSCASVPGKLLKLDGLNPRVPAGSREVKFDIAYDKLYIGDDQISRDRTTFNDQSRTVDLLISLEVQPTKLWQEIADIAKKVSFEVIPLGVTSISVQPTTVSGGAESLASFTLNFPPGPSERVRLTPTSSGTSGKAWARLLGTSCQSSMIELLQLELTPGVTNYSFKVCTAQVTSPTTETLRVFTRSADFPVSITVQP